MEIKKNQEYIVDIIDNGFEGEGIAKIDNFTVFVPGALKGEKVKVLIVKVTTSYGFAKLLEILEKAKNRTEEDCKTFSKCGGCSLRHMKYESTLQLKKQMVENCLYKELGRKIEVKETIGMDEPYYYRNKLQYPIGLDNTKSTVMGIYANRSHNIIPINQCYIQDKKCQQIAKDIYEFIKKNNLQPYDEKTLQGIFRHVVIKIGKRSNEIMVVLVVNKENFEKEMELVEFLLAKHENIKTIVKNVNSQNTNVILGKRNIVLYGNGYIYDKLEEYQFKISPLSFYQVNPIQTEILYNKAIEFAKLEGTETVYDLYCGIGTISIFIAKHAKKVYGIEIVEEAIQDAKENARINKVENVEFEAGDVEKLLPTLLEKETPDVIFVDPPRKGLDQNTIENILKINSRKVIYISCNPATLSRDIRLLEKSYEIEKVQPVDMFPFTSHVETVSVLTLKK